jgi:hypothetical protein
LCSVLVSPCSLLPHPFLHSWFDHSDNFRKRKFFLM